MDTDCEEAMAGMVSEIALFRAQLNGMITKVERERISSGEDPDNELLWHYLAIFHGEARSLLTEGRSFPGPWMAQLYQAQGANEIWLWTGFHGNLLNALVEVSKAPGSVRLGSFRKGVIRCFEHGIEEETCPCCSERCQHIHQRSLRVSNLLCYLSCNHNACCIHSVCCCRDSLLCLHWPIH